jgi:hypothetical protein
MTGGIHICCSRLVLTEALAKAIQELEPLHHPAVHAPEPAAKSVAIWMLEGTKQGAKMETGWSPRRPPARKQMISTT